MNLKEGIEKLKGLIENFNDPIVTTEQSFTEAKLMDGITIIQFDAPVLAQGVSVNVVTESGILPMPDGEYQMEDGAMLVVSGGLVAEYTPADPTMPEDETNAMPAASANVPVAQEAKAPKRVIKSQVEEHVFSIELEDYETIKIDLSSMFKPLTEENKSLKALNKEMFSMLKTIANSPSAKPTEKVKAVFSITDHKRSFREDLDRLHNEMN